MAEYIDREALMRQIKEIHCADCNSYHGVKCRACWVDDTFGYIDSEPSADVAQVRHGLWEKVAWWQHQNRYECNECSICGCRVKPKFKYNYCPNCGAKMMEG